MTEKRSFTTPVNDLQHLIGTLLVHYLVTPGGPLIYKIQYQENKREMPQPDTWVDITFLLRENAEYLWARLEDMARNASANSRKKKQHITNKEG
jgi:hypothetical protein